MLKPLCALLPRVALVALAALGGLATCATATATYTGKIVVAGSEPRLQVVLVTESGRFEIVGELRDELIARQGGSVSVRAIVVQPERGPGFPAQLEVERIISHH